MECKYDVFISYSRKDTDIANKICQAFDHAGISYFIDRKGIGGGMEFPAVLAKAIKESKVFLFLASKNSYESKFSQSEIIYAFNKKKKENILPYIIDDSNLPDELEFTFSSINWRRMEKHPIESVLLKDILYKLGKSPSDQFDVPISNNAIQQPQNTSQRIKAFFSGKNVARIVLCVSLFIFIYGLLFGGEPKSTPENLSFLNYIHFILLFPIIGCVVIGLIRPESVCLKKRKDVIIYYLTSTFILLLALGASAV